MVYDTTSKLQMGYIIHLTGSDYLDDETSWFLLLLLQFYGLPGFFIRLSGCSRPLPSRFFHLGFVSESPVASETRSEGLANIDTEQNETGEPFR